MAAPTFGSVSALATNGVGNAPDVDVPTGVASGSLVLIFVTNNQNVTSGATTNFAVLLEDSGQNPTVRVDWKRATGADSGTYSVTEGGSGFTDAIAMRIEGEEDDANPFGDVDSNTVASGTANPAISLQGTQADSMLVYMVGKSNSSTWTLPTQGGTWTRRSASASQRLHVATLTGHGGGDVNNIAGSFAAGGAQTAIAFEIRPVSALAFPDVVIGGTKKTVAATSVLIGGTKKTVTGTSVIIGGVKKAIV